MLDRLVWAELAEAGVALAFSPSPNFNIRAPGAVVDSVVVHYTDMDYASSMERLLDYRAEAGTHFVIDRNGRMTALVSLRHRAWHAGKSELYGRPDVNSSSVGIDLVFVPGPKALYTQAQYRTLRTVLQTLQRHLPIHADRVVGHEDVAIPRGRKQDPGPLFDWKRVRSWLV